jgi:hypothetical protein
VEPPGTVLDAVNQLEALGYTDQLVIDRDGMRCNACGTHHRPERIVVTHTFRFEGPSDPDEEAIVLGVECPECGLRGVVVSAYGPEADPELFDVIAHLGG